MVSQNKRVLMSGADYFSTGFVLNPYMEDAAPADVATAKEEHQAIKRAYQQAGITVERVPPPKGSQDGVYSANWALVRGNTAILASLPNKRKAEEPYAKKVLKKLGKKVIKSPYKFSGQGDALACGDLVFVGSHYRTDPKMHHFIAEKLGYIVIGVQTIPSLDAQGRPVVNPITGWLDSFFYDLDLALSVLTPNLIAWCPEAFMPESQARIRRLSLDKIEVTIEEAKKFACNLVSTGETVIMSAQAPLLKKAIEAKGLKTITPAVTELGKGGGYIRCVSLTLD